ncbi:MAG: FAD-dependent oxidoreductase [Gemmatimonadales bacterium]|nr:FAD-dependent oxidoreductase [Gemmatimonadales bacterium]
MTRPLRVAIVGSGPSGFYAAEHLQRKASGVEIEMLDRLPTPYGLVRGGVAPDHPKIKSVTRIYDRIASQPGFRFLGNVQVGRDLSHAELLEHVDAVLYATGAQTDRALGIPGEALPGSHAATEFVGWYNGHPDFRDGAFDLGVEAAAVVGVGNVAMDVARILASRPDDLAATDLAGHALDALRRSRVRTIHVLGRRGPVQAAFTNPELREFGELPDCDVIVDPRDLQLDPLSEAALAAADDRTAEKNMQTLRDYAERSPRGGGRRIVLRFLTSPVELVGGDRVEGVRVARNRLVAGARGDVKAEATGETELLPVGLVFRSVGYKGVAVPGVPFDERAGVIPNLEGRVLAAPGGSAVVAGTYVAGWIKRGPSGVIGTNKPDAVESADRLLADHAAGALPTPRAGRAGMDALLAARGVRVVSFADWQRLDALEVANGQRAGRPRLKFTRIDEMLEALA